MKIGMEGERDKIKGRGETDRQLNIDNYRRIKEDRMIQTGRHSATILILKIIKAIEIVTKDTSRAFDLFHFGDSGL